MTLNSKSILVTGGAGFIDSHLVDSLVDEKPERLVGVDDFYLGEDKIRNLSPAKKGFLY
jgi:UDP-glucose 4-epimerase